MEATHIYELPFESEFDWRVTLIETVRDLTLESLSEIMKGIKEDSQDLDWKYQDGILNYALETDLLSKVKENVEKAIIKQLSE